MQVSDELGEHVPGGDAECSTGNGITGPMGRIGQLGLLFPVQHSTSHLVQGKISAHLVSVHGLDQPEEVEVLELARQPRKPHQEGQPLLVAAQRRELGQLLRREALRQLVVQKREEPLPVGAEHDDVVVLLLGPPPLCTA